MSSLISLLCLLEVHTSGTTVTIPLPVNDVFVRLISDHQIWVVRDTLCIKMYRTLKEKKILFVKNYEA